MSSDATMCQTCRWWCAWTHAHEPEHPTDARIAFGDCRVRPPKVLQTEKRGWMDTITKWPSTRQHDWCAEHSPVVTRKEGSHAPA